MRSVCKPRPRNTSPEHHGRRPQGTLGQWQTSGRHLLAVADHDKMTEPAPCDSKHHPWLLKPCLKCYARLGYSLVVELCLACVRPWLCSSAIGRRRGRGNPATATHIKNKAENYFFPRHGYSSIRRQLHKHLRPFGFFQDRVSQCSSDGPRTHYVD